MGKVGDNSGRQRVLIVDDHSLYRRGLATLLEHELAVDIADVGTADQAIGLAQREPIDLAIVDVVLPPSDGIWLTAELRRAQSELRILGLSALDDPIRVAQMLRAGASGFALKAQAPRDILDAVRSVLRGERYLAPTLPHELVSSLTDAESAMPLECLSPRELEVFKLLVRGQSNHEVAAALFIAPRTVETHRQRIMNKLEVHTIVDLVRLAVRYGALEV